MVKICGVVLDSLHKVVSNGMDSTIQEMVATESAGDLVGIMKMSKDLMRLARLARASLNWTKKRTITVFSRLIAAAMTKIKRILLRL